MQKIKHFKAKSKNLFKTYKIKRKTCGRATMYTSINIYLYTHKHIILMLKCRQKNNILINYRLLCISGEKMHKYIVTLFLLWIYHYFGKVDKMNDLKYIPHTEYFFISSF